MKNVKQDWAATREAVRGLQETLDKVEHQLLRRDPDHPHLPEGWENIFKGFGAAKAKQGG